MAIIKFTYALKRFYPDLNDLEVDETKSEVFIMQALSGG